MVLAFFERYAYACATRRLRRRRWRGQARLAKGAGVAFNFYNLLYFFFLHFFLPFKKWKGFYIKLMPKYCRFFFLVKLGNNDSLLAELGFQYTTFRA